MASQSEANASDQGDSSSDDECLLDLKRKVDNAEERDKRTKYSEDSDDEPLLAEVLVTVEVEEVDEGTLDYGRDDTPSTSRKKRKQKPKRRKPFRCHVCKMVFDSAPDLKRHSLDHQVQTRHKCDFCGRCFKKAFSLRMHKRVHEDKEQKCPLCDLTFNLKINLGRHLMTHERPDKCDKCPARFHTKEQLEEHKMAHDDDRGSHNQSSESDKDELYEPKKTKSKRVKKETIYPESNGHQTPVKDVNPFLFNPNDDFLKRESLSHPTQCAIVSKLHKGRPIPDICRLYNLTPEVVNEIWEDRDKYTLPKKAGKKITKYMNNVLDTRIVEWFQNQKANDVPVSGKMLQDVAEAFAKECGFVAFNGSKKWLDRFKKKYNILLRGTPNRRDYNNYDSKWKKLFFAEQWADARLGIADEDIYTADEVGVFYNPSKGRIKKMAGKKFIQGYVKDRLSIFLCANVPGTDKRKLVVCGTEDPLLHSHRDPDTLPVTYIRHTQAHFTTQMFEEYVKYWNRELQLNNKKAILILDRATIHSKLQLSHLKLVFVPWKASTGLIPVKNGIYTKFREEFRRLFLEEKAMNVIRGVDRNITCLEALNMVEKAWDRTPPEVITKSFLSTGYDVQEPEESTPIEVPKVYENDEEIICRMLQDYDVESYYSDINSLDMYLTVDEELVTGQGTNCSVFGGNHKVVENAKVRERDKEDILPIATEKPESEEKELIVRKSRAIQDLEIVRKYLQSNNTTYETYCTFMEVEKFVMRNPY